MNTLFCKELIITEWYDGVVQGLILSQAEYFYAMLLAWDVNLENRVYLIFGVKHSTKDAILHAYEDPSQWPKVLASLKEIISRSQCFISREIPRSQATISVIALPQEHEKDFHLGPFIIDYVTDKPALAKYIT